VQAVGRLIAMMRLQSVLFGRGRQVALVLFAAFFGVTAVPAAWAERPLNERPMYGYDTPKTDTQLAADAQFVKGALDHFDGSRKAAARASIELGWKYFEKGDLPTSIKRFNQAYLLDPTHGGSYAGMAVVVLVRGGQPDEAEGLFQRAINSHIITDPVHVNYGLFLMQQNRNLEAEVHVDAGLKLNPDAFQIRFVHAGLLDALGRTEESLQEIGRACGDAKRFGGFDGQPDADMIRAKCADIGMPLN